MHFRIKKGINIKLIPYKEDALATTYFPISKGNSIIGAGELNYSVRNGKRCIPTAITTKAKLYG